MRRMLVMMLGMGCRLPFPTDTDETKPDETGTVLDTQVAHTGMTGDTGQGPETGDTSETGLPFDTGDTSVEVVAWRQVAGGSWFGLNIDSGDSGIFPVGTCDPVSFGVVTDQAALDAYAIEYTYGYGFLLVVDFAMEVAIPSYTVCNDGPHTIIVDDITSDGPHSLVVSYHVTSQPYVYAAVMTLWNVVAVEGTDWTSVTGVYTPGP